MHMHTHTHTHSCIHTHTHSCIHILMHTHIHTPACTHTCMCTHPHPHTQGGHVIFNMHNNGHVIFNMHNNLSACCVHEGKKGTDECLEELKNSPSSCLEPCCVFNQMFPPGVVFNQMFPPGVTVMVDLALKKKKSFLPSFCVLTRTRPHGHRFQRINNTAFSWLCYGPVSHSKLTLSLFLKSHQKHLCFNFRKNQSALNCTNKNKTKTPCNSQGEN